MDLAQRCRSYRLSSRAILKGLAAACNGSAEARSASTVSRTKEPARRFEPEITETFELLRQARVTNSNLQVSTFPVLSGLPEECKFEY